MNWIIVAIILMFASYGLVLILNEVLNIKQLVYAIVIIAVAVGSISAYTGGYYYLTSWIGLAVGGLHVQDKRL